jgi:hypothetical protein
MNKRIFFSLVIVIASACFAKAQELNAKVTINASRIGTTVDKKIFTTLQTQLTSLLNSRLWGNDQFKSNEKIDCSFLLNL